MTKSTPLLASSINNLVLNELRHTPNISGRDVVRSNNGNKQYLAGMIGNITQQFNAIVSCSTANGKGVEQVLGRICVNAELSNNIGNWDHFKVKDDEKSEGKDTLEAKSTLLIKLITDVLLPKINNSGAVVKGNNAFSRDTQILSDIASSKEIVVPKSISFRPQGKTIVLNFDEEQTLNTEKAKMEHKMTLTSVQYISYYKQRWSIEVAFKHVKTNFDVIH